MSASIQPHSGSRLLPSIEKATVADAMHPGVMSCEPRAPAVTVARMMATHRIHAVVVDGVHVDAVHGEQEQVIWGLVSDLDLARAAYAGADALTASDLAATEPVTIEPSVPLAEAAKIMDEHGTAHLIVVDRGRPVGVISTLDVAAALAWGRG